MTQHKGFSNYQTWCAHQWLTTEEASQRHWQTRAQDLDITELAGELKALHEQNLPELKPSPFLDLLNHALGMVDWREVAEGIKEGA